MERLKISRFNLKKALVFTGVELVTLPVWLYLGNTAGGIVSLLVGLTTEHVISVIEQ